MDDVPMILAMPEAEAREGERRRLPEVLRAYARHFRQHAYSPDSGTPEVLDGAAAEIERLRDSIEVLQSMIRPADRATAIAALSAMKE